MSELVIDLNGKGPLYRQMVPQAVIDRWVETDHNGKVTMIPGEVGEADQWFVDGQPVQYKHRGVK